MHKKTMLIVLRGTAKIAHPLGKMGVISMVSSVCKRDESARVLAYLRRGICRECKGPEPLYDA